MNISKYGTYFKYIETHTDTVVYLSTVLLGVASVINISLSIMVARFLGIEFKKIEQVVLSLPYINHRLELRIAKGGASVIYDAYNSNENSFAEMLKMVALFDVGYKILITPGVVELGASQYSVNVKISKLASDVFDEIWVINRVNKYAFIEGVKGSKCIVNYYDHLDVKIFEKVNMFDEKVLVVFENDLPDIYK